MAVLHGNSRYGCVTKTQLSDPCRNRLHANSIVTSEKLLAVRLGNVESAWADIPGRFSVSGVAGLLCNRTIQTLPAFILLRGIQTCKRLWV
jgi:hypothetical protein